MIRRSLTPPIGTPVPGLPPTRRTGGARRNVSYRVSLFRGATELPGWALNISRGGLRAVVEDPVALGEELEVVIAEEALRRPGRVVWTQEEPDGMIVGISFLERMERPPPGVELDSSIEISPGELAQRLELTEAELAALKQELSPPREGGGGSEGGEGSKGSGPA